MGSDLFIVLLVSWDDIYFGLVVLVFLFNIFLLLLIDSVGVIVWDLVLILVIWKRFFLYVFIFGFLLLDILFIMYCIVCFISFEMLVKYLLVLEIKCDSSEIDLLMRGSFLIVFIWNFFLILFFWEIFEGILFIFFCFKFFKDKFGVIKLDLFLEGFIFWVLCVLFLEGNTLVFFIFFFLRELVVRIFINFWLSVCRFVMFVFLDFFGGWLEALGIFFWLFGFFFLDKVGEEGWEDSVTFWFIIMEGGICWCCCVWVEVFVIVW